MARTLHKLTPAQVTRLDKPGKYYDGAGLLLQVTRTGSRAWAFRYQRHGREVQMGLGPLHALSLAEARKRARACRQQLADGIDPLASKRARTGAIVFRDAAKRFIEAHEAGWRNAIHHRQWIQTLEDYVDPAVGTMPVTLIETSDIVRCLKPVWESKPETARRTRSRIAAVLDWAIAHGFRTGPNPADWSVLRHLFPNNKKPPKSHTAVPWKEMPDFMRELRRLTSISARALELVVLTGVRTSEARFAECCEFDINGKVWTIPAARTKSGREHLVPLSEAALAVLEAVPREDGSNFMFAGPRRGKALGAMAMLECQRGLRPKTTVHGHRSALRTWAGEATDFPAEVAEAALGHLVGSQLERTYRRGTFFAKRCQLLDEWSAYLEGR